MSAEGKSDVGKHLTDVELEGVWVEVEVKETIDVAIGTTVQLRFEVE